MRQALEACGRTPISYRRLATEGEADLHLGGVERPIDASRAAVSLEPTTSELQSTYLQAGRLIEVLGRRDLRNELAAASGMSGLD